MIASLEEKTSVGVLSILSVNSGEDGSDGNLLDASEVLLNRIGNIHIYIDVMTDNIMSDSHPRDI